MTRPDPATAGAATAATGPHGENPPGDIAPACEATRSRHGAWSLAEAIVWPAGLLVLGPVITRVRNIEAYGSLLLMTAVVGAAPVLMAGAQSVLTQRLAARPDRHDDEAVGSAIALMAGAALVLVVCGLAWLAGSGHWAPAAAEDRRQPLFVMACVVGAIGLAMDQVSLGVLKGTNQFRRSAQLELGSRGLQIVAAVGAAALVTHPLAPAIALGFATLAGSLLRFTMAIRSIAWSAPAHPVRGAASLLRSGWWMLFGTLGGYLYMSVDRIVVGSLLGARALAIYGLGIQIAQFTHMLPAAYFQPILPAAARLQAGGDRAALRRLALGASLKALAAVAVLAFGTWLVAPAFISHGLKHVISADDLHMLWLCMAAAALMGLGVPIYYVLMGLGRFAAASLIPLVAGVLLIALLGWIGSGGDLVQCAGARVVAAALMLVCFAVVLHRELGAPSHGAPTSPPGSAA